MDNVSKKTKGLENIILITQVGINMVVPIIVGLYIGKKLDESFNKAPLFLFLFIIIGVITSFMSLFKLTTKDLGKKRK